MKICFSFLILSIAFLVYTYTNDSISIFQGKFLFTDENYDYWYIFFQDNKNDTIRFIYDDEEILKRKNEYLNKTVKAKYKAITVEQAGSGEKTIENYLINLIVLNGKNTKNQSEHNCNATKFSSNDSIAELTGLIAKWDEASAIVPYRGLWLVDSENDTIIFYIYPDKTKNIVEKNLGLGNCVSVLFETEIIAQNGVEVNRFFHAKSLSYP